MYFPHVICKVPFSWVIAALSHILSMTSSTARWPYLMVTSPAERNVRFHICLHSGVRRALCDWDQSMLLQCSPRGRHPRNGCWPSHRAWPLTPKHSPKASREGECIKQAEDRTCCGSGLCWPLSLSECDQQGLVGRQTGWKRLKPYSSCACGLLQRVRVHESADFPSTAPCCRPAAAQGVYRLNCDRTQSYLWSTFHTNMQLTVKKKIETERKVGDSWKRMKEMCCLNNQILKIKTS